MTATHNLPAQLAPVSMLVTQEAIIAYARITGDFNPLHVDPAFAAKTPMGGVIAHGTMSLNLIWQTIAGTLPAEQVQGGNLQIRFTKPVRLGRTVTASGAISAEVPGTYTVWADNDEGVRVIEGTFVPAQSVGKQ